MLWPPRISSGRLLEETYDGVRTLTIPWDLQRLSVGASIGIAAIGGSMSVDDAVAAADAQCYLAKAAGKNNVQVDAGANFGLNRQTPDVEVYCGVSVRF